LSLAPGDLLVLVTDGITEAQAPDGARYQRERLSQVAQRHAAESADRICQAVLSDVAEFVGARSPTDDITIVVIKTCEPLSGTGPQQAGRSAGR
jgi:sigma-B regulation protein RsbU (phosphoserine phosphatase)